jgi:uncharacterized membrane protein
MADKKSASGKCVGWLRGEIIEWQEEGIITAEQSKAILLQYGDVGADTDRSSRLVAVLGVLGSLLLGAGIIIFFAANWQAMSKVLKLVIIFGSVLISYSAGYYLAFEKNNYPRIGRSLIFLGTILYGAGIWLIAQVFHISSHYPNGILFWLLGILPMVFLCKSLSVLLEACLLLSGWTFLEQVEFESMNYMFLLLAAAVFGLSYFINSRVAVALSLVSVVAWTVIGSVVSLKNLTSVMDGRYIVIFILLLTAVTGLVINNLGRLHQVKKTWSNMQISYQIVGLAVYFISLFILTFKGLFGNYEYINKEAKISLFFGLIFALAVVFALGTGLYLLRMEKENKGLRREQMFVMLFSVFFTVLIFSVSLLGGISFIGITNILMFVSIAVITILGYTLKEPILVNFGLVFFVIDLIARYFDFFWDMMDKSIFFIIGGLILLVGGTFLERNRRKILMEMKVTSHAD